MSILSNFQQKDPCPKKNTHLPTDFFPFLKPLCHLSFASPTSMKPLHDILSPPGEFWVDPNDTWNCRRLHCTNGMKARRFSKDVFVETPFFLLKPTYKPQKFILKLIGFILGDIFLKRLNRVQWSSPVAPVCRESPSLWLFFHVPNSLATRPRKW